MRSSCTTHRHVQAQLVCALYVLIAQGMLRGEDVGQARVAAEVVVATVVGREHKQDFKTVLEFKGRTGSGHVLDCYWSALEALEGARSYQEAVVAAIKHGHDTDTTACVAGGLAGIKWGLGGIPEDWLWGMQGRWIVEPLVAKLTA
jgi:ADP-ribosylglycohydrolase